MDSEDPNLPGNMPQYLKTIKRLFWDLLAEFIGIGLYELEVSASLLAAPLRDPLDPTTRIQIPA